MCDLAELFAGDDDTATTKAIFGVSDSAAAIAAIEPHTLEGVFVHLHALEAIFCGDPIDFDQEAPATDMRLAIQIVRGLQHVREARS